MLYYIEKLAFIRLFSTGKKSPKLRKNKKEQEKKNRL